MAITIKHIDGIPYFGKENLLEIAPNINFSEMIFELLSTKRPNEAESKIFETILNLSIDHGEETPSAIKTIGAAKGGKTISESVSAGILQINDMHGGAIEPAMNLFYKIKNEKLDIKKVVDDYLDNDRRMPGFGHRIYDIDPRAQLIFKLARQQNISDEFIEIAQSLEKSLKSAKGKPIPVNIDGAIASILCTFGWNSNLGNAVFIIARIPGLCGQFLNNSK